jgi:plasmid stabilization system protein ParE
MSRRVILRPDVPADLHNIVLYLEKTSITVADRFVTSVFAAFESVAESPGHGSPKHFPNPGLAGVRSWPVSGFPNHLIYYQTHAEAVIILGVMHGARNVPRILEERRRPPY